MTRTEAESRYDAIRTAQDDYSNAYSEEGEDIDSLRAMLRESYLAGIDGTLSPGETLTADERERVASAYATAYCALIAEARRETEEKHASVMEAALDRAATAATSDATACTDATAPEGLAGYWLDMLTADECEALSDDEQETVADEYRAAFLRVFNAH